LIISIPALDRAVARRSREHPVTAEFTHLSRYRATGLWNFRAYPELQQLDDPARLRQVIRGLGQFSESDTQHRVAQLPAELSQNGLQ